MSTEQRSPQDKHLEMARAMTTDQLKAAWNAFDETCADNHCPRNAPHIEDVHRVLNERGEGAYCAV